MKLILPLAALAAGFLAAIEPGTPAYRFDDFIRKLKSAGKGNNK